MVQAKLISTLMLSAFLVSQPIKAAVDDSSGSPPSEEMNRLAPKAPNRLLMDIDKIVNQRLIAVGERGHILVSDDLAKNWRQILVPTDVLLTKQFFLTDKIGWIVGHEQVILKTESAGELWQKQHQSDSLDQPALFDVWFADKNHGIAVGAYGLFLATKDGGETWVKIVHQNLEDPEIGFPHFYSLAFDPESKTLYMAGEFGSIAKSTDNGETWQPIESPYDGSFFNIMVTPKGSLLVMGLRGHLFRSTDDGETWDQIDTDTISGLQEAVALADERILIVGADGTQLVSDNDGLEFTLVQRSDRVHLSNAVSLDEKQTLIVGVNGVVKTEL